MKKIVRNLILLTIITTVHIPLLVACDSAGTPDHISLTWITDGDLEKAKSVFVESFLEAYSSVSEKQLGINNKQLFIEEAFQEDQDAYSQRQENVFFVTAQKGPDTVGYASFETTDKPGEVYIRQLSVDPGHQRQGIGRELVFSIKEKIPNIKRYVLVTRRINEAAKQFYFNLGFKESDFVHEGLDPIKYVGYEFDVQQ